MSVCPRNQDFGGQKTNETRINKNMKERIEALMAEIAGLTCKTEQEIEEIRHKKDESGLKSIRARWLTYYS